MTRIFDIAVIGGGVNGTGVARDAAGRGLSVLLVEANDLASATSSASTKLIHGGLRYLEHYAFGLVRHALAERETLWNAAPHIIWPMRFVLPHRVGLRPVWTLRAGLFLYDHIGGRGRLPPTRTLRLDRDAAGVPLRDVSHIAFEYSDCWVQDARLVVLNARDAEMRGADVRVRTRLVGARREGAEWRLDLEDSVTKAKTTVRARAIVNAAGPWVGDVIGRIAGTDARARVRLVQGSHIVVPKLYDHGRCYFFENPDARIFFAIPYEEDLTLIGTTDRDYHGDPARVTASEEEVEYLRAAANRYFRTTVEPEDVVWKYSGVRPLYDDGASAAKDATRDYVLTLESGAEAPPLLSVFGGKITTYRRLAEDALKKLSGVMPEAARRAGWTASAKLPGGDFPIDGAPALAAELRRDYAFLSEREAWRYVRHYGTESRRILGSSLQREDLGRAFGGDLTEAEVDYLIEQEYVRSADDVIWRRTKSGLRMRPGEIAALGEWMTARQKTAAPAHA
jgi:glycerol-3-phosphate dehydrogenase